MSNLKMQKADYPEERKDWLMVEEYAKRKSIFGCILCDKTHSRRTCEHKAKRTEKIAYAEYRAKYGNYVD